MYEDVIGGAHDLLAAVAYGSRVHACLLGTIGGHHAHAVVVNGKREVSVRTGECHRFPDVKGIFRDFCVVPIDNRQGRLVRPEHRPECERAGNASRYDENVKRSKGGEGMAHREEAGFR